MAKQQTRLDYVDENGTIRKLIEGFAGFAVIYFVPKTDSKGVSRVSVKVATSVDDGPLESYMSDFYKEFVLKKHHNLKISVKADDEESEETKT